MDIKQIAEKAGGVVALSHALGLSRGAVSQWTVVPDGRVLAVCEAAGWLVTPHQVRPDLYPNPCDALPDARCNCEQSA
jgi:DNA-binding transcriptional regulator YdaS (Cro superfamily)